MSGAALVHLSSPKKLSTAVDRLSAIDRQRLIHRITQAALAAAALITKRWYIRLLADASLATEAVLSRLEVALRGLIAAAGRAAKTVHALLAPLYHSVFALAAQHYGLCPQDARGLLTGEERPADPVWRAASHTRQAALYLVNSALGVSQQELAAVARLSAPGVCLALRAVETRRDDPAFDAFLDRAALHVTGGC